MSEAAERLSPIPGAAPPEEPQVDEVILGGDEDEEAHDEGEDRLLSVPWGPLPV